MNIKDFAEKLIKAYDEALLKGNTKPLKELEDPNVVYHMGIRGDIIGSDAHEQDILGARMALSDIKMELKYLAGEGNLFALSYKSNARVTGEKPGFPMPIGKNVLTNYLFVCLIKKGKIVEAWSNGTITGLN